MLNMDELINDVKRDAKDFAKEVAGKSGVDLKKEEFIGVEGIIRVDDLERELDEKKALLEQNEETLKDQEKLLKSQEKKLKDQQEKIQTLEKENRKLKLSKKK